MLPTVEETRGYDFQDAENAEKWKGLFVNPLKKVLEAVHPTLTAEESALEYVESLCLRLLAMLCAAPSPLTVQDVEERVARTFPTPLDKWALQDARDSTAARKRRSVLPADRIHGMLQKEVLLYKIDMSVSVFMTTILEYVSADILKLAGNFVKKISQKSGYETVTCGDIKTAMCADKVLMDMFYQEWEVPVEAPPTNAESRPRGGSLSYAELVRDLLADEKHFLRDLNLIIRVFKDELETILHSDARAISLIFGNIVDIYELTVTLLGNLEDAIEMSQDSPTPYIGSCFEELAEVEEFRAYVRYANIVTRKESREALQNIVDDPVVSRCSLPVPPLPGHRQTISMSFEKPVVVIDNGSYNIKAGFACDNHPVSIFRTVVGRPSFLRESYGRDYYDVYIGDNAASMIQDLELSHPVVDGRIVHWDNMERIWHHCFYRELKVAPEDRAVILGCSTKTPMDEKIKCCEVFFETLNAPAICIQSQSVLSMYGSGCTTGMSVDLGYDSADIVPIYEGGAIAYAHMQTNLAGRQISNIIKRSLTDRNIQIKTPEELEELKQYLYLTKNTAMSCNNHKRMHKLPSGELIDVGQEAFMTAEMMIQPELVCGRETEFMPLQECVVQAALKCDAELSAALYDAVVPCGGLSTIPGLNERLTIELEKLTNRPVNVLSSPESYSVSWLGGATFAGMSGSNKMWLTRKQYEDQGVKIIKNKFLV